MAIAFNLDPKKVAKLGGGSNRLKAGKFAYKITGARLEPVKSDVTGREQVVIIDFEMSDGYTCSAFIYVMSSNDVTREIAEQTLMSFADAIGHEGTFQPKHLKKLINAIVVIDARENAGKGKNSDKTYINISSVEAYDDTDDEDDGEDEEVEASDEGEEEAEEEEEESEPAPAKKSARPW